MLSGKNNSTTDPQNTTSITQPLKNCNKAFISLCALMGHDKKSLRSSDSRNMVNLHIFKMAAIENFNVFQTFYGWF